MENDKGGVNYQSSSKPCANDPRGFLGYQNKKNKKINTLLVSGGGEIFIELLAMIGQITVYSVSNFIHH